MKTKSRPKYFTIEINAGTEKELNMRIADNESRGFKIVKVGQTEKHEHVYRSGEYRGINTHNRFRAVMRREERGLESDG